MEGRSGMRAAGLSCAALVLASGVAAISPHAQAAADDVEAKAEVGAEVGAKAGTSSVAPDVAFRRMRARRELQFDLPGGADAEPDRDKPERGGGWLSALVKWLAGAGQVIVWGAVALLALGVVWFIFQSLRDVRLNRDGLDRRADAGPGLYQPEAARVRTLLEQVDALAREGRYREAVHRLLFRAIEDIDRARPGTVRRSLTSREIGRLPGLTPATRDAFVAIARINERGWFAGRDTDRDQFEAARGAYARFDGRSTSQPRLPDATPPPPPPPGLTA